MRLSRRLFWSGRKGRALTTGTIEVRPLVPFSFCVFFQPLGGLKADYWFTLTAAIRHLASYYAAVLAPTSSNSNSPDVILLTDDADNKRKAVEGGIVTFTVKEYVESQTTEISSLLMDLLASVETGPERRRGEALYPEVRCFRAHYHYFRRLDSPFLSYYAVFGSFSTSSWN